MLNVVFAANNDSYRRRERVHRACIPCKRRRRRCAAPLKDETRCGNCKKNNIECSFSVPGKGRLPPALAEEVLGDPAPPDSQRRFIGDLSPEAIFLTVRSRAIPKRDLTECGVWDDPSNPSTPPVADSSSTPVVQQKIPRFIPPAQRAYLESILAFSLPPSNVQKELINIYLAHIHPLLPILDVESFLTSHAAGTASIPLLHSLFLITFKHPSAAACLPQNTSVRTHSQQIHAKTLALLHSGLEKSRLTQIRIHAFLSLYSEGPSGNDSASLQLTTALHISFSLGLHLDHGPRTTPADQALWWTLWTLDAQLASLCGRPLYVRLEDISVPQPRGVSESFDRLLDATALLLEVISLYRPGNQSGWHGAWPEILLPEDDSVKLLYYAVCILAHRNGLGDAGAAERRSHSADEILRLCGGTGKVWPPVPCVPYAVALALATFYVEGREEEFEGCCEVLEGMSEVWFAGAMAKVGREARERMKEKEAAGVLSGLAGIREEDMDMGGEVDDGWYLQLFPDLAVGEGLGELDRSWWDETAE